MNITEIQRVRKSVRVGDVVQCLYIDGVGATKTVTEKRIKVSYIGQYYMAGETAKGVKETIMFVDYIRAGEKLNG